MGIHQTVDTSANKIFTVIMAIHEINEFVDFEFIICLNGNALHSRDLVRKFCRYDGRVRLLESRIGQLSYLLNLMADCATGEWLVRMDSDDLSHSERLAVLRHHIESHECEIVGSAAELIDGRGKVVGLATCPIDSASIHRKLISGNPFIHPTVAIKFEVLKRLRGYNSGFVTEDIDLWLRASRNGVKMSNIGAPLLQYRLHNSQSSRSILVYAEGAGLRVRELFIHPTISTLTATCIAIIKVVLAPVLVQRIFRGSISR